MKKITEKLVFIGSAIVRPIRLVRVLITKVLLFFAGCKNALSYYGSLNILISKSWWVFRNEGLTGLARKAWVMSKIVPHPFQATFAANSSRLYETIPELLDDYTPKVSVIVPNYNHAPYLRERLESIYNQSYKNIEVILLDDCSNDGSQEILKEYAVRFSEVTVKNFNTVNSGGVFNQWRKGLSLAQGELVWIAESDDYCSTNMLDELVRFFKNEAVMLAFCRSDFVQGADLKKIWESENFLADLKLNIWSAPFIRSAHWLVNHAWGIKNIVPNASCALFRHPGNLYLLNNDSWRSLKLCGDWVFYLNIIRGGLVGYSPLTTNFYRQHEQGTSFSVQKKNIYYKEHEYVATHIQELYRITPDVLKRQRQAIYIHWRATRGSSSDEEFNSLYSLDRAYNAAAPRKPNLMMAGFALIGGGGETFPIMLANQLKLQGVGITFLNCKVNTTEQGVRSMLDKSIPLVELSSLSLITEVCKDMGIELIHSHHAWVDMMLVRCLHGHNVKHVISMHGMYEEMPRSQLDGLLPLVEKKIDRVVYTAEKNLVPFTQNFRDRKRFIRIDNALAKSLITPANRSSLGLAMDDFVLCMVARAIPEKGWEEAIKAVKLARENCPRKIHLLLIGNGPEFNRLKSLVSDAFIHFLGFKSNIRDYFAMSDIGFLPSRFRGESFPLVLIDCLFSGKPVLASDIGEIKNMLQTQDGLAGEVFELDDGMIPIADLASKINKLADDRSYYERFASRVEMAAAKFDVLSMTRKYMDVYESVINHQEAI